MTIDRAEVRNLLTHVFPDTEVESNKKILAYRNDAGCSLVFQNEPTRTEYCFWLATFPDGLSPTIEVIRKSAIETRTSGLNGKTAPELSLGNPVTYLKTKNYEDVELIVEWFSKYKVSPTSSTTIKAGYLSDTIKKKTIELYAMSLAEKHYRSKGYEVIDTSASNPFDLRCILSKVEIHVEVKGTTSKGDSVDLTAGEVAHCRRYTGQNDLFIVKEIQIDIVDGKPAAKGGKVQLISNWLPKDEDLTPTQYRYFVGE